MKLRNSFISLKTLSDELNLPIVSTSSLLNDKSKISIIVPVDYEHENQSTFKNIASNDAPPPATQSEKSLSKNISNHGKNLKKSMLNDNKLIKLRNKFLKRSKSSPGMKDNHKTSSNDGKNPLSTEENQNKENECPKLYQHEKSAVVMLSPNRNRVKMGTRVFSAQFLNKSYENIYTGERLVADDFEPNFDRDEREQYVDEPNDDGLSLKSTSLSSLYFSEKMSEKFSESPLPSEAYVIRK